jgi:hypothetical protein
MAFGLTPNVNLVVVHLLTFNFMKQGRCYNLPTKLLSKTIDFMQDKQCYM